MNRQIFSGLSRRAGWLATPLFVLALALTGAAQQQPQLSNPNLPSPRHPPAGPPSLLPPHVADYRLPLPRKMRDRMRREQEQINAKKIQQESAELVSLSRQLQQMLAHSSRNVLPVKALEKVEKIEKLAKQLRKRIRQGGEPPQ